MTMSNESSPKGRFFTVVEQIGVFHRRVPSVAGTQRSLDDIYREVLPPIQLGQVPKRYPAHVENADLAAGRYVGGCMHEEVPGAFPTILGNREVD